MSIGLGGAWPPRDIGPYLRTLFVHSLILVLDLLRLMPELPRVVLALLELPRPVPVPAEDGGACLITDWGCGSGAPNLSV